MLIRRIPGDEIASGIRCDSAARRNAPERRNRVLPPPANKAVLYEVVFPVDAASASADAIAESGVHGVISSQH
jgi:hypothetical protein